MTPETEIVYQVVCQNCGMWWRMTVLDEHTKDGEFPCPHCQQNRGLLTNA